MVSHFQIHKYYRDTNAAKLEPLVTNAAEPELLVTLAAESEPLVTSAARSEPLVTNAAESEPLIANAAKSKPLITSAAESKPLITSAPESGPVSSANPVLPRGRSPPTTDPRSPPLLALWTPPPVSSPWLPSTQSESSDRIRTGSPRDLEGFPSLLRSVNFLAFSQVS